jgi:hypothetical protein
MYWIAFVVLISCSVVVESQIWVGNFTAVGTCNEASCCCIGPDIELGDLGNNLLKVHFLLHGNCYSFTEYSNNLDIPNGFTISITRNGITITIQLEQDSNTITITNSFSESCAITAARNVPLAIPITTTTKATSEAIRFRGNLNTISIMLVMGMSIYMKK